MGGIMLQFLPMGAILVTLMVCLNARAFGESFGVMAIPDGRRKTHAQATPQLGGMAILAGFAVLLNGSLILQDGPIDMFVLALLLGGGGLALVGFVDDRHEIPPASRI